MRFEEEDSNDKIDETGRKKLKPHPDSQSNLNFAIQRTNQLDPANNLEIKINDKVVSDGNYQFTDAKNILFIWRKITEKDPRGNVMTINLNFHQRAKEFREQLENAIDHLTALHLFKNTVTKPEQKQKTEFDYNYVKY